MIKRCVASACLVTTLLLTWTSAAYAQGSSNSSISGTVVDSGGGAIPGAAVVVKGESGATFEAVTNSEGVFNIPAVNAGSYKLTVTLTGFTAPPPARRRTRRTPSRATLRATLRATSRRKQAKCRR